MVPRNLTFVPHHGNIIRNFGILYMRIYFGAMKIIFAIAMRAFLRSAVRFPKMRCLHSISASVAESEAASIQPHELRQDRASANIDPLRMQGRSRLVQPVCL